MAVNSIDNSSEVVKRHQVDEVLKTLLELESSQLAWVIIRAAKTHAHLWEALAVATKNDEGVELFTKMTREKGSMPPSKQTTDKEGMSNGGEPDKEPGCNGADLGGVSDGATNGNGAPAIPLPKPPDSPTKSPLAKDEVQVPESNKRVMSQDIADHDLPADIIQFSTAIYFCKENEGILKLDVNRLGQGTEACSAKYETHDCSAKAGVKYVHTSGILEFAPGEVSKEIHVKLLQDANWDATLEFEVRLTEPVNANLGRYLYHCRVKVIDDDFFPTNQFCELVEDKPEDLKVPSGSIPKDNLPALLVEYFKMNYSNKVVRKGTIKCIIVDSMHNMYFIWRLILMRYLIDKVIGGENQDDLILFPGNAAAVLICIMILIILPFAFLHHCDIQRLTWKVGGTSRKTLQTNLLRKFLNYDEESRHKVRESDLVMAMTRDVTDLVDLGYGRLLPLAKNLGRLGFILTYQVVYPLLIGKLPNPMVIAPVLIFPFIMFTFLKIRNRKTLQVVDKTDAEQNSMVAQVCSTISNYRLIADYNRRPYFIKLYEAKIGAFNGAAVKAAIVCKNNQYFAPWVSIIIIGIYTVFGGLQVINDPEAMTVGAFVVNVDIFKDIGASWGDVYKIMLDMMSIFPALGHIVTFMNLPTDVGKRMELNRERRQIGAELRAEKRDEVAEKRKAGKLVGENCLYVVDLLPIKVMDVKYEYSDKLGKSGNLTAVKGTFEIEQGNFVALVGANNAAGKSTMLKLLGNVLLPGRGLFVPPHLRTLHISEQPLFFEGTLKENLLFGVHPGDDDGRMERIEAICRSLSIPESLISLIASDTSHSWAEVLSMTTRVLVNMARAVIANPEVLCIHKPTLAFDNDTAAVVLKVLKSFVEEKGVLQDHSHMAFLSRRNRTCIITAARTASVRTADLVFQISPDGVKKIEKHEITEESVRD